MKRRLIMGLLGAGVILGFGSGFASLACHRRARQHAFEQHIAHVCVDAARNAESH